MRSSAPGLPFDIESIRRIGFDRLDDRSFDHTIDLIAGQAELVLANESAARFSLHAEVGLDYKTVDGLPIDAEFFKYLDQIEAEGATLLLPDTGQDICCRFPHGFCRQRTGWICHLLATTFADDLEPATPDEQVALFARRVLDYGTRALETIHLACRRSSRPCRWFGGPELSSTVLPKAIHSPHRPTIVKGVCSYWTCSSDFSRLPRKILVVIHHAAHVYRAFRRLRASAKVELNRISSTSRECQAIGVDPGFRSVRPEARAP